MTITCSLATTAIEQSRGGRGAGPARSVRESIVPTAGHPLSRVSGLPPTSATHHVAGKGRCQRVWSHRYALARFRL
eukprot:scaffold473869_cov25-Prasinocladus_malaysianus.AAC.1